MKIILAALQSAVTVVIARISVSFILGIYSSHYMPHITPYMNVKYVLDESPPTSLSTPAGTEVVSITTHNHKQTV